MRRFCAAATAAAMVLVSPADSAGRKTTADPAGLAARKDGSVVQQATGLRFPKEVDGFLRTSAEPLDPAGRSVVASYGRSTGNGRSVARIAVVEINDMTALEHFAGMSPIVGTYFGNLHFSNIKPISNGPLTYPAWHRVMPGRVTSRLRLGSDPIC